MITQRFTQSGIECLECVPQKNGKTISVLFLHGAFVGGWCWAEHFMQHFANAGYASVAPSYRNHGESRSLEGGLADRLQDFVDDAEEVLNGIDGSVIVVGHSLGGAVAQRLYHHDKVAAMVLMASVPPYGLMNSVMRQMWCFPKLYRALHKATYNGIEHVDFEVVLDSLVADSPDKNDQSRWIKGISQESNHAVWDVTVMPRPLQLPVGNHKPVLVVGSNRDKYVAPFDLIGTAAWYAAKTITYDDCEHAMMLGQGWQKRADDLIDWINALQA